VFAVGTRIYREHLECHGKQGSVTNKITATISKTLARARWQGPTRDLNEARLHGPGSHGCRIQANGFKGADIMKAIGLSLATVALLMAAGVAHASHGQSTSSFPLTTSLASDLAAGTTICGALAKSIDAKKAKPGDAIVARVTLPVLSHGKVIIPNDAKVTGHVTWAKTRSRGHGKSELGIVFDRAVLKDGSELPLSLTVQAIGRESLAAAETASQEPYNPNVVLGSTSRQPGHTHTSPLSQPPSPPQPVRPQDPRHPTLDSGSHGAIGLPDLTLTESADAASGSMVKSPKKNVRLDSGTEVMLRVIGAQGGAANQ
jgi:hypothetical protein